MEPLLFLAYMNGLFAIENNNINIKMFEDDPALYSVVNSEEDPQLQSKALYPVEEWCLKHNMKLDIEKSSLGHITSNWTPLYFSYTLRNSTLTKVKVFRLNIICQFDMSRKCRVRKKKTPKTIVVLALTTLTRSSICQNPG